MCLNASALPPALPERVSYTACYAQFDTVTRQHVGRVCYTLQKSFPPSLRMLMSFLQLALLTLLI